ncbi:MAG: molybdopterin-dependent oxidoreductase [Gammaproteobacteria bacterium]
MKRRDFLKKVAAGAVITRSSILGRVSAGTPEFSAGEKKPAVLESLEGKIPLIKRTYRPPNFETPLSYLDQAFTPNDAFFVRYHLSNIPKLDAKTWKLRIGGDAADKAIEFTLDELKKNFAPAEIAAVNQCAGNRRGLFQPPVPGVQWGHGAMGNAWWKGVRLKDVLAKSGIHKNALEVVFDGADSGVLPNTPDFSKSLPLWKAVDENTLIAFEMNGNPLPYWNGYPARLVVPGWVGTYWMKHLTSINVIADPCDSFWMKTAYRIPTNAFPLPDKFDSQKTENNTPITEIAINSLITNVEDGQKANAGQLLNVRGIAWDGGHGIERVEISGDDGKSWRRAELKEDYGPFSWRQWQFQIRLSAKGPYRMMVKATNRKGDTQPLQLIQNPGGYHHNQIQKLTIFAV